MAYARASCVQIPKNIKKFAVSVVCGLGNMRQNPSHNKKNSFPNQTKSLSHVS